MAALAATGQVLVAVALVFGALVFWPMARHLAKGSEPSLGLLKALFAMHVVLQLFAFGLIAYLFFSGNPDWLHGMMIPYGFGAFFWVASSLAMATWLLRRRKHQRVDRPST